ncbi:DUF2461 domain-containing protein [Mariniblastus fucicola]|uniref:TIGR02453 family protein n=1 Tax=Mariniblastus fucicola TaxID=980251 RepID=A0A5B9P5H2_9BACT|nr:DUF2461 domain-containing protein [Mariniblastus fucicola]QEG20749.1 hypothetical protein MFFC18_06000 [Mariniblastus fucicola]
MADTFNGFPPGFFKFYKELVKNNERDWFNANKDRYLDHVVDPALAFITAIEPKLKKVSPYFTAVAKRSGGSLMRIYRDTRFSKNKQPYKTNLGIHFRHEMGKNVHAPGFYFHYSPTEVFLGAGIWHPDREPLKQIRTAIVEYDVRWKRAKGGKKFKECFELSGDTLKRPPRDFDPEHKLIEDLKRKDFIAVTQLKAADMKSPEIVDLTIDRFKRAKPLVTFLCDALHVPS